MAEQLQQLIDKIKEEGVKAAEDRSAEIEREAKARAAEIVSKANKDAGNILAEAKRRTETLEESMKTAVRQAGRDFLLSVRQELDRMLKKLIAEEVKKSLSSDTVAHLAAELIKDAGKTGVILSVTAERAKEAEKYFIARLSEEARKGVTLRPSDEAGAGFLISYDSGRSFFDLSDEALIEYIRSSVSSRLADILK
jgi:V/A-type H+-transporting ATPase subunit E